MPTDPNSPFVTRADPPEEKKSEKQKNGEVVTDDLNNV
jgi:hypothetical protein